MPSAIHIGGATARVITRAGPGAVPVVAAAAVEANQARAGAAAVAAEVRTPVVGRAAAAAHTSRLQPHLLTAPTHESLTVKYRRLGGPSHKEQMQRSRGVGLPDIRATRRLSILRAQTLFFKVQSN